MYLYFLVVQSIEKFSFFSCTVVSILIFKQTRLEKYTAQEYLNLIYFNSENSSAWTWPHKKKKNQIRIVTNDLFNEWIEKEKKNLWKFAGKPYISSTHFRRIFKDLVRCLIFRFTLSVIVIVSDEEENQKNANKTIIKYFPISPIVPISDRKFLLKFLPFC